MLQGPLPLSHSHVDVIQQLTQETKSSLGTGETLVTNSRPRSETLPTAVLLLVVNGFLLMYAFSTETIYAVLLKEKFGYGEVVMGLVLALNGVAVGLLQVSLKT